MPNSHGHNKDSTGRGVRICAERKKKKKKCSPPELHKGLFFFFFFLTPPRQGAAWGGMSRAGEPWVVPARPQ